MVVTCCRRLYGGVDYLSGNDTRQYLYCLTPRPELYADKKVLKGVTNIGKLDIVWKTNMGEKGRLQTSQLQRVVSGSLGMISPLQRVVSGSLGMISLLQRVVSGSLGMISPLLRTVGL